MKLRPEFQEGLKWQLGNGKSINFWIDNWVFQEPLLNFAIRNNAENEQLKVEHFITPEKNWKKNELLQIVPSNVVDKIIAIPIPRNDIEDRIVWAPSKNGWFSTASALSLITKESLMNPNPNNWIWKLDTYPKVKNFLWKIDMNGLPTKQRLSEKQVAVPPGCLMCNSLHEDSIHLMIKCPHTLKITKSINANTEHTLRNYSPSL